MKRTIPKTQPQRTAKVLKKIKPERECWYQGGLSTQTGKRHGRKTGFSSKLESSDRRTNGKKSPKVKFRERKKGKAPSYVKNYRTKNSPLHCPKTFYKEEGPTSF